MKSIYDVIKLDDEEPAPPPPPPAPKQLPTQLTMIGCGRHEFRRVDPNTVACMKPRCGTVIHKGQLLYALVCEAIGEVPDV